MFNLQNKCIFSAGLSEVFYFFKKMLMKVMGNLCDYNSSSLYKFIRYSHLKNQKDSYYFSLKRLYRLYGIYL